jgi:hypothetical protein
MINEKYDMPSNIQVPVAGKGSSGAPNGLQTVSNPAIPNSWFTADIRVGSITLHLEEDTWQKGQIIQDDYDSASQIFENLAGRAASKE